MTSVGEGLAAARRKVAEDGRALRRLADVVGIVPEYLDQTGKERRVTTDETRIALLAAMGVDASTPARAAEALDALRRQARAQLLEPVRVLEREPGGLAIVRAKLPATRAALRWSLEIEEEGGRVHRLAGSTNDTRPVLTLAAALPIGYHNARLWLSTGRKEQFAEQSLIVVPPHCTLPDEVLGSRKAFGIVANLYTLHSERNWGIGDFTDLATLATWAGRHRAGFVGVNPLHALLNSDADVSPYSPISRLFRNVAYIDVERVPELKGDVALDERIVSPELQAELATLREGEHVHYDRVMELKGPALEALYRRFADRTRDDGSPRAQAYREYVREQGEALTLFATFMAIGEHLGRLHRGESRAKASAFDWRRWPAELRDPRSEAVREFEERHADAIEYHKWLQFECDRQLGEAAKAARDAGMSIGLYQDLAIGTSGAGCDTWAHQELFVRGASVGAPPDPYASMGQNWGLPPMNPAVLRRDRYQYYIRLLRSGFRHAGALRIDHAMGLFRLFWIPEGMTGKQGAYIRYPASDLLGILALESARHRALVVGEDLGTVPKEVPPTLRKWGVLSSKVLYFERDKRGHFRPAAKYPELSLATANTHDMATIAGFWRGRDVELRVETGLVEGGAALEAAREERARDRQALVKRLQSERVLPSRAIVPQASVIDPAWESKLRGAVHAFLCKSPAVLVGLSLDDLTGETEAVNLPGVGPDLYPSWTRRMHTPLEELERRADVLDALRCEDRG